MSRVDDLNRVLRALLTGNPEIETAAVVSEDGSVTASTLPQHVEELQIAATSTPLLSLGTRAAAELGRGGLEQVLVRGSKGRVVMSNAAPGTLLLVLPTAEAKLDLVFLDMKRTSVETAKVLWTRGHRAGVALRRRLPAATPSRASRAWDGRGVPPLVRDSPARRRLEGRRPPSSAERKVLDPGGHKAYAQAIAGVEAQLGPEGRVAVLFFSHQDPDVNAAANDRMMTTDAVAYICAIWTPFVPTSASTGSSSRASSPFPTEGCGSTSAGADSPSSPRTSSTRRVTSRSGTPSPGSSARATSAHRPARGTRSSRTSTPTCLTWPASAGVRGPDGERAGASLGRLCEMGIFDPGTGA